MSETVRNDDGGIAVTVGLGFIQTCMFVYDFFTYPLYYAIQQPWKKVGIYILEKIRNYTEIKIQIGETLPKLNIGINSKFGQNYRYDIAMYDFN